jgi:TRAP-type C4-dicarboxylate transport system permease small subunit
VTDGPSVGMLRLINRTAWAFAIAGGLCAGAVALLTIVSIVGRSWFQSPIPGDFELVQQGIALAISLCLPWCQAHGGNIIVDFFTQRSRARTQRVMDGVGCMLLALMVGLLSWRTAAGALVVQAAGETSMILGLPGWWVYAFLAPGLALTCLIALVQAGMHWSGGDLSGMRE